MKNAITPFTLLIATLFVLPAMADSDHDHHDHEHQHHEHHDHESHHDHDDDGFTQHGSHVHGEVALNIAQDGNALLMEITAPGADIVGFEHAPENAKQRDAITHAKTQLQKPEALFRLDSAAKCKLEDAVVSHEMHDNHSEFSAQYHYDCQDIAALDELNTQWFSVFPTTQRLSVNSLTEKGTQVQALSVDATHFHF